MKLTGSRRIARFICIDLTVGFSFQQTLIDLDWQQKNLSKLPVPRVAWEAPSKDGIEHEKTLILSIDVDSMFWIWMDLVEPSCFKSFMLELPPCTHVLKDEGGLISVMFYKKICAKKRYSRHAPTLHMNNWKLAPASSLGHETLSWRPLKTCHETQK